MAVSQLLLCVYTKRLKICCYIWYARFDVHCILQKGKKYKGNMPKAHLVQVGKNIGWFQIIHGKYLEFNSQEDVDRWWSNQDDQQIMK